MAQKATLFYGIFLALAAVACGRQEAEVPEVLDGLQTITASGPESKTVFSQFTEDNQVYYRVLWENGDKIGLFTGASGQNQAEYTTSVSSPSAAAAFTHTNDKNAATVDGYYFAVFPYQTSASFGWGSATTAEKKNCHVILPFAQTAVNGGAPREACVLAARSTDTDFAFQHVFSYIRFVVGEDFPDLTAVRVTNRNGKKMADRMNIYYQYPNDEISVAFNELKSAVKSWCELKPASPATVFAPGVYYIAVWPRVYEDGLSFAFVDSQNDTIKREITSQVRLNAAGSVANVGTVRAEEGPSGFIPPAQNSSFSVDVPAAATLQLTNVRAAAYVTTVKVASATEKLCGKLYTNSSTGKSRVAKGLNEVVYNTLATEVAVREIPIALCPGTYDELQLTFTTSKHQVIRRTLTNVTLTAGQTTSVDIGKLVPETDILFWESFDANVWGGNLVEGDPAYAPTADAPATFATAALAGNEQASVSVPYNQPGTGYFQTNKTSEIGSQTVAQCHLTSDAYLKSRNFWDYTSLYRGQEMQGCLGLSVSDDYYFKFQPAPFTNITGFCNADLEFDLRAGATFDQDLSVQILNGGWLVSAEADGVALPVNNDNHSYLGNYDEYILSKTALKAGEWVHVTLHLSHLSDASAFCLTRPETTASSQKKFGCLLDNVCLTRTQDLTAKANNTLRVLYWNIQYGMWTEQGSNYNNFVNWIKKMNPDVCVFCEGKTVYSNEATGDYPWSTNPYLPDNWSSLASRYNHSYVSVWEGQVVTAKSTITRRASIPGWKSSGGPVNAGADLVRISAGGKNWYFIPTHLWAQSYAKAVRDGSDAERAASAELHEGNLDRRDEMQTILNQLYVPYKNEATYLYILGDLNAQSRDDIWFYSGVKHWGWVEQDPGRFLVYDVLSAASPTLYDVVYKKFNGTNLGKKQGRFFFSSNCNNIRKDMVWANSGGYNKVVDAYHPMDSYVNPLSNPNPPQADLEWSPSDHRPIIFDINLN